MARVCDLSGKGTSAGRSRRHQRGKAGGVKGAWSKKAPASKRTFRVNIIENVKVIMNDGEVKKVNVAAKILKRMKNFGHYKGIRLAGKRGEIARKKREEKKAKQKQQQQELKAAA